MYQEKIIYLTNVSYPGMCKKCGVLIGNTEHILKLSDTEMERINLCSEKLGISLCEQLCLNTSHVRLINNENKLCLLSKKWELEKNEQYFPLASFYEELLDRMEHVPFSYSLFKDIIRRKAPEKYDDILHSFWGMFIVDYLICNSRSAGNIGFLNNGDVRLAPIFDCSTSLESLQDSRYKELDFPDLLVKFNIDGQYAAYNVLTTYQDVHKDYMMQKARTLIKLNDLENQVGLMEEEYMFDVITYRYNKLFSL